MTKTVIFLLFCMIFVSKGALAQSDSLKASAAKLSLRYQPNITTSSTRNISSNNVIPSSFYVNNLGFFCKKEIKLEAATGIPFKFRLGSVQYCDRMEGKRNAGYFPASQF